MVQLDEGAWVDPLHVTCVRAEAIGTQGFVRVTLDNHDTFDVLHHACELNAPDASLADQLMDKMMEAARRVVI